jgi:beta-fructofuranosidase
MHEASSSDRERFLRHRPRVHLQPPSAWVNDPNGPIFWEGRWHLFYQYNPAFPGFPADMTMSWGHAVSDDLVDWRHLPIALSPRSGDPDASGCWSGSVVERGGQAIAFFSTAIQSVCRAETRDAGLERWTKRPEPVLSGAPPPWDREHFRDPFVFAHEGVWLMCLAGQHRARGVVWLLRSRDLEQWEPVGPLLTDDPAWPWTTWRGVLWECPALVPFGDRWLLLVGAAHWGVAPSRTVAFVGRFDGERFHPESCELYDHGLWYAPICARHAGRTLAFGWIPESCGPWLPDLRTNRGAPEQGWAGVLSLPHELMLDAGGRLRSRVIPEFARLRDGAMHDRLDGLGDCAEVRATWANLAGPPLGLACLNGPNESETTRIVVDPAARTLTIDRSRSTLSPDPERWPVIAPLADEDLEHLELHVVVDRSVVHVIANGRLRISARSYPSRLDSVSWSWVGRPADTLQAWPLRATSHQRTARHPCDG